MAAAAQTINVLQAVILTDKEKMVLTPTYHVFEMYKVHQDATLIPVVISAPEYKFDKTAMTALNASASRDKDGKLHLSLVNLDPNKSAQITMKIAGAIAKNITGRVLTAGAMDAINTFDKPDAVKPVQFTGFKIQGDQVTMTVPSKSVVVLEIQ